MTVTITWAGIAFGYINTTQGSTTATLVSQAGPVSPSWHSLCRCSATGRLA